LARVDERFGHQVVRNVTSDEILSFLTEATEGQRQSTKRYKYTILKSFFNFTISLSTEPFPNPCDTPILRKTFRIAKGRQHTILEKDLVDEAIFKTENPRNRLMLELMARGGMRVGEVLKLRAKDVNERRLHLRNPKSGWQSEVVFIPQKVADRLKIYIQSSGFGPEDRIFPIRYTAANNVVKKAGRLIGVELRPHDLRRHAATYASRTGAPLEIVSKVILRHANLSTTQRYLGKVSDTEAMQWIENLYG